MKFNIDSNDALLLKAQEISGIQDKKELIEKALKLYVSVKSQNRISDLGDKAKTDDEA